MASANVPSPLFCSTETSWLPSVSGSRNEDVKDSSHVAAAQLSSEHGELIQTLFHNGRQQQARCFRREALSPGDVVDGPALISEALSTTVIDPGWAATVRDDGQLLVCRDTTNRQRSEPAAEIHANEDADPVLLEVFNRRFASIAEQMGQSLKKTASSVNVRERLDFSCAIFTPACRSAVSIPENYAAGGPG